MYFRAVAGLIGGLVGGIVSGALFLLISLPNLQGTTVPLLTAIARVVGYDDPGAGWSFHLFVSCIAGAIFGALAGRHSFSSARLIAGGMLTGLIVWVVAAVVTLPYMLGYAPHLMFTQANLRPALIGMLFGSIIYGVCLGVGFMLLYLPVYQNEHRDEQPRKYDRASGRRQLTGRKAGPQPSR